jgi:hypothetical protein
MKFLAAFATSLIIAAPVAQATPSAYDRGLMVNVPGIGYSRVETLSFCLNLAGVDKYQDLLTDSEFSSFGTCMADNT